MTDLYAKNEKALWVLHEQIVSDIRTVLNEKGYVSGEVSHNYTFELMSDRLLINDRHTDHISTDELLKCLRDTYYVLLKTM